MVPIVNHTSTLTFRNIYYLITTLIRFYAGNIVSKRPSFASSSYKEDLLLNRFFFQIQPACALPMVQFEAIFKGGNL
jgi:hypothetical protein